MIEEFTNELEEIAKVVKNKPSPEQVLITAKSLSEEISIEQLRVIMPLALKTFSWWPTPAEFSSLINGLNSQSWDEEWAKILSDISRKGIYKGVREDLCDETVGALNAIGGFEVVCNASNEMLPTIAAQFRMAFANQASRKMAKPFKMLFENAPKRKGLVGMGDILSDPENLKKNLVRS